MRHGDGIAVMLLLAVCALGTGCKGPAGATGPMGPSGAGAGSPVYFLNQDFDGNGYNPSSQFTTYGANGGTVTMGLTSSDFVSAPYSLSITATGIGSGCYTAQGAFPYLSGYDYYLDTYVNLEVTSPVKVELVLVVNGNRVADFGYATPSTEYTYNNGATVNLSTAFGTGYFHHVVLYWNHTTGLSSITIDGNMVAQNISGLGAAPTGAPTTCGGLYYVTSTNSGNYVLVDNITVYHY